MSAFLAFRLILLEPDYFGHSGFLIVKRFFNSYYLTGLAAAFMLVAGSLLSAPAEAALKCEERVAARTCTDGAPRQVNLAPGQYAAIAAPVIPGYPSACWTWNRKFQCVETDPQLWCDSGNNFNTVKNDCNLTAAAVKSSVTINSINYITEADYTYRCAYGEPTTNDQLPNNKECVKLDEEFNYTGHVPAAPPGADPGSTGLTIQIPTTETRADEFVCYSPPVTTCTDTCYETVRDPATGTLKEVPVPCGNQVQQCQTSSTYCEGEVTGTDPANANLALGPDGRCINSTEQQICSAGTVPRCLSKDNCQLSGTAPTDIQNNGFAAGEEQTYVCSNSTTTCTELSEVSSCVHVNAWGWDNLSIANQIGQGLGEYNQAMSRLEGIDKGMNAEDPFIFSGQDLRCHYAVGNFLNTFIMVAVLAVTFVATSGASVGMLSTALQSSAVMGQAAMSAAAANATAAAVQTGLAFAADAPNSKAFGGNCCRETAHIEGSDKPWKLRECSADEIKLSVAKQKGLSYYLGDYCSKRAGFPIKQCVQRTKSYCVFDDMLALVVNEQGRAQLDEIAMADSASTSTSAPVSFSLYGNYIDPTTVPQYSGYLDTGSWVQRVSHNGSKVLTWQYPGYCADQTKQAAAYEKWNAEMNAAADTKGIQPDKMTQQEAAGTILRMLDIKPFQECAPTPGTMAFMTCGRADDSCGLDKLPESPSGVEVDLSGANVSQADVNWNIQQGRSFFKPGDYGVTATMPSNSAFAAVTMSVSEFATAVGSCHKENGQCLYYFSVTDKTSNGGLGARKRTKDYAQFPLYTVVPNSAWPGINYMDKEGNFSMGDYMADPNRGVGNSLEVSNQRFIFHPHFIRSPINGNIHTKLLLEHATTKKDVATPANDYTPLAIPSSLPVGTQGFYPYGNQAAAGEYFYLSGQCDPNSKWCNYTVEVDLNVARHPWGSAKEPRCWGFSIEQMAALDFDRMDLSKWINSLDLDASTDLTPEAAQAMTDSVLKSADSFYGAVRENKPINNPTPGTKALVLSSDSLPKISGYDFAAYHLQAAVPANWPNWFVDQPNNNPVTNVRVDWGDGSPVETMIKHPEGKAWIHEHDYGDLEPGRYKVEVTFDTEANGPQRLTSFVTLIPSQGGMPSKGSLDFDHPGSVGQSQGEFNPADTIGGINQAPGNIETLAPGMVDQFDRQGSQINKTN